MSAAVIVSGFVVFARYFISPRSLADRSPRLHPKPSLNLLRGLYMRGGEGREAGRRDRVADCVRADAFDVVLLLDGVQSRVERRSIYY